MTFKTFFPIIFVVSSLFFSCGGGEETPNTDTEETLPNLTPSDNADLSSEYINTMQGVTLAPQYIDFSADEKIFALGEDAEKSFVLTNSSGAEKTFKMQVYSISSGFLILNASKKPVSSYDEIKLAAGESATFYIRFTAEIFGQQSIYVHITANTTGYIQMPVRGPQVLGDTGLRVIPTGYKCADTNAPYLTSLRFGEVPHGKTEIQSFKICNEGTPVSIYSSEITNEDAGVLSTAFDEINVEDFWSVPSDQQIASQFSSGIEPQINGTHTAPNFIEYSGSITNPAGQFSISDYDGKSLNNVLIGAGSFYWVNVAVQPNLPVEAPEGSFYKPVGIHATLKLQTSLGVIKLPLAAASSGSHPKLDLKYATVTGAEIPELAYRNIDLASNGPAIRFETPVEIFTDWVTENYQEIEIQVTNTGSGTRPLEFFGEEIQGYFEYSSDVSFPLVLESGESQSFRVRYLPSPAELPEEQAFDFGKFYFKSNTQDSQGLIVLVGEQDTGSAVAVTYQGADLSKYSETDADGNFIRTKNFCSLQTSVSGATPTSLSFVVKNNSKIQTPVENKLTVNWSFQNVDDKKDLDLTSSRGTTSGSFVVAANGSESFTAVLPLATTVANGQTIKGQLVIKTSFTDQVATAYAADKPELKEKTITIPFQATASDTGICEFDSKFISEKTGIEKVTLLVDRITMAMMDLPSLAINIPSFKFHMDLEVDLENGLVRVAREYPFIYDQKISATKQMRAYLHQVSNPTGCAPRPTIPHRGEFERGSFIGGDYTASNINDAGVFQVTTAKDGLVTIYADSACMDNNGAQPYTDPVTGETKTVFYSEFFKFDGNTPLLFGKISTFAFDPSKETIAEVFRRSEEDPSENEAFYEQIYGGFSYDSYLQTFGEDFNCGQGTSLKANTVYTDPDLVKTCFLEIAGSDQNRRDKNFQSECGYFNFSFDEGTPFAEIDADNFNPDNVTALGKIQPYVNEQGEEVEGLYDLTLNRFRMQAFVIGAVDRKSFLNHPGHLIYSDMYVTFTTKVIDDRNLMSKEAQTRFEDNQIILKDDELYDLDDYFTNDGTNNMFTNVLDPFDKTLELGKTRGNFVFMDDSQQTIAMRGYPFNAEQNMIGVISGMGYFSGKGNTSPNFTRGNKPLYFSLKGCLMKGHDLPENQGCMPWTHDSAIVYDESGNPTGQDILEVYTEQGLIPATYEELKAYNCAEGAQSDPDFRTSYKSMGCVNYVTFGRDRNVFNNYVTPTSNFVFPNTEYNIDFMTGNIKDANYADDDFHTTPDFTCGYGM